MTRNGNVNFSRRRVRNSGSSGTIATGYGCLMARLCALLLPGLLPLCILYAEQRVRDQLEAFVGDRLTAHDASTVVALLDAIERRVDLRDACLEHREPRDVELPLGRFSR